MGGGEGSLQPHQGARARVLSMHVPRRRRRRASSMRARSRAARSLTAWVQLSTIQGDVGARKRHGEGRDLRGTQGLQSGGCRGGADERMAERWANGRLVRMFKTLSIDAATCSPADGPRAAWKRWPASREMMATQRQQPRPSYSARMVASGSSDGPIGAMGTLWR